jgi:hypothetical protein
MFNFLWGLLFVAVNFTLFLLVGRLFGKNGLYAWVGLVPLLANIQVVKTIEMLGIVMTLGNTIFATLSMTTDLINERFGQKAAKQAVWLGFFSLVASTVIMQMVLAFQPQAEDIAQGAMETLFGLMPRVAAASLIAYLAGQFIDVRLFGIIRRKFSGDRQFWIRVLGSTGVSQFVDSLVFCTIAFIGLYSTSVWFEIVLTTYLLKFIIAAAGTPVLYVARKFRLD